MDIDKRGLEQNSKSLELLIRGKEVFELREIPGTNIKISEAIPVAPDLISNNERALFVRNIEFGDIDRGGRCMGTSVFAVNAQGETETLGFFTSKQESEGSSLAGKWCVFGEPNLVEQKSKLPVEYGDLVYYERNPFAKRSAFYVEKVYRHGDVGKFISAVHLALLESRGYKLRFIESDYSGNIRINGKSFYERHGATKSAIDGKMTMVTHLSAELESVMLKYLGT